MTMSDTPVDLRTALTRARRVAEDHMVTSERLNRSWKEETITDLLCVNAAPFIISAEFSKRQEGAVGADWLWWWIDGAGECFGMLAQAKRLKRLKAGWTIDFGYRNGEQIASLFRTAELFSVPAVYMLYFGSADYRDGIICGPQHVKDCARCQRASVSLLAALIADQVRDDPYHPYDVAEDAFRNSSPLEDLADPATATDRIVDVNLRSLDRDVRAFLMQRQAGARHVARLIFERVSAFRLGQLAAAAGAEPIEATVSTAIFRSLPRDRGHFRESYYEHVLRGLRAEIPPYVQDVLVGQQPPPWVIENVRGIVVARC